SFYTNVAPGFGIQTDSAIERKRSGVDLADYIDKLQVLSIKGNVAVELPGIEGALLERNCNVIQLRCQLEVFFVTVANVLAGQIYQTAQLKLPERGQGQSAANPPGDFRAAGDATSQIF